MDKYKKLYEDKAHSNQILRNKLRKADNRVKELERLYKELSQAFTILKEQSQKLIK
jgi:archaellum component FlaC